MFVRFDKKGNIRICTEIWLLYSIIFRKQNLQSLQKVLYLWILIIIKIIIIFIRFDKTVISRPVWEYVQVMVQSGYSICVPLKFDMRGGICVPLKFDMRGG